MRNGLQLLHQPTNDVFLERAGQDDVVDRHAGMLGREALDSTDPLLNNHRIPGQVEVDEHVGGLKVDALRASLC